MNKKQLEKKWEERISKHLIGRTITKVEYIGDDEMENNMWYKKPIAICLDNKDWLIPMADDEGNDGGAISTTFKELGIIPVI